MKQKVILLLMIFSIISIMIPPMDNTSVDVYAASDTATCSECNGKGKTTEYGICDKCNGKGTGFAGYACSQCNKSGYAYNTVACGACSGTGYVSTTDTVTITYHLTGGYAEIDVSNNPYFSEMKTVTTLTQTKLKCEAVNLLKTKPYKAKNKFVGWSLKPFGNGSYSPGDEYIYNNRTDLYAVWEPWCNECDGDGEHIEGECQVCGGVGYEYSYICAKCDGRGKVAADPIRCEICNGTGRYNGKMCPICLGSGIVEIKGSVVCNVCNGTGTALTKIGCMYCENGLIIKTCSKCKGSGFIQYEIIYGDTNLDDEVNITDVVLLQKYLLCATKIDYAQWLISDMNGDGSVDVFDLVLLKRKLLYQDN